ncbi:hypothetical protein TetV_410 [Tetraselmis virus 1]|uniref:Uncharacterized protein n=1 Tax=Tetraselmis virus 1 TaxID=2060617 RepID=A0A2P0VNM7_9VIRU|nr:hypothetical protein QJ968_gp644 [Tetraselmis virus 1]AUF82492.1 hypothetical protein TetV_410 [Tetraselmis virus 1]
MSQSWTVLNITPAMISDKMFVLGVKRRQPMRSVAYTMDVRVKRDLTDLADVVGVELQNKMESTEIVEGLLMFETDVAAERFLMMHDNVDQFELYSVPPEETIDTLRQNGGVVVMINGEDPPNPVYCKANLLNIAYDLSPQVDYDI